ncbi:MAG TPA: lytic transglycosylase domain-containing protein [Terriglobia bacterium]|nr:lytic transglycosylase domain-containing protein [Terriglobia bacterium]
MNKVYRSIVYMLGIFLVSVSSRGAAKGPEDQRLPSASREVCQTAVLRNGFTLRYLRREAFGATTRLWVCGDGGAGYVEVASEEIERLEPGEPATLVPTEARPSRERSIQPRAPLDSFIAHAAMRHQVDADFISSVVKAESAFNPTAVSSKGARGLMQLMPQTAAMLGVTDAFDPAANVEGGTKYLRQLLDYYQGDALRALAAYNAGWQRVRRYGGVPPYRETRAYVARVIDDYNRKKSAEAAASRPTNR